MDLERRRTNAANLERSPDMKLFPLFVAWAVIGIGVAAIASRLPGPDTDPSAGTSCNGGTCGVATPDEGSCDGCLTTKNAGPGFASVGATSAESISVPDADQQAVAEILKIREQLGGSAILPILEPGTGSDTGDPRESELLFREAVEKMAAERSGIR
jgi:hypothetical protein